MSWITVELTRGVSHIGQELFEIYKPDDTFARTSYKTRRYQRESSWKEEGTNVFHGSKEVSLLTSILDRPRLEKTMLLYSCDGYHMQGCVSLTVPGGVAICESSP